jgi:hypothetical protein
MSAVNGKKRRSESPVTGPKTSGLVHYSRRLNTFPPAVPYDLLRGCTTITQTLEREIRNVILNENLYEISFEGRMPVNRFLRFFGAKSSSKETAVLSFAFEHKLEVLMIRSPTGFEPQRHLKELYSQAKELQTPVLIVLKNIDMLFQHDKDISGGEAYKRALNTYAFAEELQQIRESRWKVWTIILTTSRVQLYFDVDIFFQHSTEWAGLPEIGDIFDDKTRGTIIIDCLRKYVAPGARLPFDANAAEVLAFAGQFTSCCTYRQIDEFVRTIVNRWKFLVPPRDMLVMGQGDTRLVPTTKDFIDAMRGKQSISAYPATDNISPFLSPN